MPLSRPTPRFFARPEELRRWFEANHCSETELWVGFYKKGSGRASVSWAQAVDEALCFGWIDGIRKRLNAESYVNRFTPRRKGSNWSLVNTKRVAVLRREGRMTAAGLAAFKRRDSKKTGVYSFEQRRNAGFDRASAAAFRRDQLAWASFQAQAPWYRRTATFWVMSAKQDATRVRRLARLIEDHRAGRRVGPLRRSGE
jgi:uncharacterized protein YdeI (YjbR/CyaY-like superfamily)